MNDTAQTDKTKARWKSWLGNILILLVGYYAIQAFHSRDVPEGIAPAINGELLDGRPVSLQAYRGQPVLVYFWATWCSICRIEQGVIDELAQDYPVITIASQSGTTQEIREAVTKRGITAPVLADEYNYYQKKYGIKGFPTSFIIAPDGSISDVEVGITSDWGFRWRLWWAQINS